MAITLEQATFVASKYGGTSGFVGRTKLLDVMRMRGVRRENVEKNIGKPFYAFNVAQRATLPKSYQPPHGTYGAGVS